MIFLIKDGEKWPNIMSKCDISINMFGCKSIANGCLDFFVELFSLHLRVMQNCLQNGFIWRFMLPMNVLLEIVQLVYF